MIVHVDAVVAAVVFFIVIIIIIIIIIIPTAASSLRGHIRFGRRVNDVINRLPNQQTVTILHCTTHQTFTYMLKLNVMNSQMGLRPAIDAPTAMPAKPACAAVTPH